MVSNLALAIFSVALVSILVFSIWSRHNQKKRTLLHNLYQMLALALASWMIAVMCMRFADQSNKSLMFFWDCMIQPGGSLCAPLYLCIAITFVEGYERMQKWMKALFIGPVISILVAWTNPLHHLQFKEFSVVRSEIVFGPYVLVSGALNYIYLMAAIIYMIRFALKNKTTLYWKQCILFTLSGLCPLLVSAYATFSGKDVPISATPMSFIATVIFNGIAIYQLHMLDITPVATRHILDAISDGYLVLNEDGLVLSYNKRFEALFAAQYGIEENRHLKECVKNEDIRQKTAGLYGRKHIINSSFLPDIFIFHTFF